ncbi:MAG: glycerate-2-kinase family protein, partial [Planctomycetes bacterium]|nr:glycerate-2-kinase family protein [Planctomycetota bacterium]
MWQAGVAAVQSDRLVRENVRVEGSHLLVGDKIVDLAPIQRIVVVGTGKAGAGMAQGIEVALGEPLMAEKKLVGWINVPADCVRELSRIKLHPARPAGVNEPTEEGVAGTEQILRLVGALGPNDLCLCLISGGGSALMPAPVDGISLQDKQAVTKFLSAAGANILQLNTVRKQLSRVKGNGLARACRAGRLISLIISDVIGDPLDIIASRAFSAYDLAQAFTNPAYINNATTTGTAINMPSLFTAAQAELQSYLSAQCGNTVAACANSTANTTNNPYVPSDANQALYQSRLTYGL